MTGTKAAPYPAVLILLALAGAATALAPAQERRQEDAAAESAPKSEEPARQTELTEEVEVRLVQVAILARDRHGRPVTDLTADEIEVKDRRREMRVAYLDPFVDHWAAEELPDVRLFVEAEGVASPAQTRPLPPRRVVFFVDVENDFRTNKHDAIRDIARYIQNDFNTDTQAAVMAYTGDIEQLVGFTTDREAIAEGLSRAFGLAPRPNVDLRARIRQLIDNLKECVIDTGVVTQQGDPICVRQIAQDYLVEQRPYADDYLDALEGLVRYLGGLPGRKVVFALSHGTPADTTPEVVEAARAVFGTTPMLADLRNQLQTDINVRQKLDRVMELAIDRKVALNFVDRNPNPTGDYGASQGLTFQPGAFPMRTAFEAPQMELQEIAANTGGVFVHSPNDLYSGVKQVSDAEAGAYELGYYVEETKDLLRLNKIKVRSKRKGVRISHRRGYYRRPESAAGKAKGELVMLRPNSLAEQGREGQFLPFKVLADPTELGYEREGDAMAASLTLHVRVENDEGRVLTDLYSFTAHGYPVSVWGTEEMGPVVFSGWTELPPGQFRLVATVTNPKTGQRGEFARDIEVRRVARARTETGEAEN